VTGLEIFVDQKAAIDRIEQGRSAPLHIDLTDDEPNIAFIRVRNGTQGGHATVLMHIISRSGETVLIAQTTLALMRIAVQAFDAAEQRDNEAKASN
jgi:lactate dehydrogenase-like 2-hydroxyacid dehydrogenase